jgi:hypothetical protein
MRRFLTLLFYVSLCFVASAQYLGKQSFSFLNLPSSARASGLGGKVSSIPDGDLSLVYFNPSILNESMVKNITTTYVDYFYNINYGNIGYVWNTKKLGPLYTGIQFAEYGKFVGANDLGEKTGDFNASEYAFMISYANNFEKKFYYGVTLKPIYSHLETYVSMAFTLDLGVSYISPDTSFMASLTARNLGFQIFSYYPDGEHESLPFEFAFGMSKKLKYAPFRIVFLLDNLQKFDLSYDKNIEDQYIAIDGSDTTDDPSFISELPDLIMRHVLLGVEVNLGKSLSAQVGYNYRRRQEMKIETKGGMVGFSLGVGLKLKKFSLNYARESYSLAGGTNNFTLTVNTASFYKKKTN